MQFLEKPTERSAILDRLETVANDFIMSQRTLLSRDYQETLRILELLRNAEVELTSSSTTN